MSQPAYQAQKNGMGTAGFVCGLIGLVFSFIPVIGIIAWPLVIIGIVLSAIGMNYANQGQATNRGLAVAGLVVSVIGLVMCILWVAAIGSSN
jgi:hypothetical protein